MNEDFAVESLQGDVFQLGNTSYRILRVERGTVRVEDAHGQAPSIPFWLGEAPARSEELSAAVSQLRKEIELRLQGGSAGQDEAGAAMTWPDRDRRASPKPRLSTCSIFERGPCGARLLADPRQSFARERFFDESGGMQLIIHSTFGSRVNRAWGLSLRKRFCRTFNFELQACSDRGPYRALADPCAQFGELAEAARYLHSNSVRQVLVQALCAAPMS